MLLYLGGEREGEFLQRQKLPLLSRNKHFSLQQPQAVRGPRVGDHLQGDGEEPPPPLQEPLRSALQTLPVPERHRLSLPTAASRREVSRPLSDGTALTTVHQHPATLQGTLPSLNRGAGVSLLHSPSLSLGLEPGQPALKPVASTVA